MAAPAATREPLIGHFVGDYLVIGRLGNGGFGKVLLGLQRPLFRLKVAIKLLEVEGGGARMREKAISKFENEAASLAVLRSPHVVQLLQYGSFDGRPFMAMEYVPGSRTLQREVNHLVLEHGALEPHVIRHVLAQILNGLEAAHEQDIIHRDIKPENVMLQQVVGDAWFVKIVDFGLAKLVAESRETSQAFGTVHYMAPEQIEGKNLGPWTDLYAVGVIAFELMTAHRPFVGRDVQDILRQKLDVSANPLARLELVLPEPIRELLQKALHRSPEHRFQSTKDMREALARAFDRPLASVRFTEDLSDLIDSADLARIRREDERLADERRELAAERQRLTDARAALESDRMRLDSNRLGRPADVEHAALGRTGVLPQHSRTVIAAAPTQALLEPAAIIAAPQLTSTPIPLMTSAPAITPLLPVRRRRWPLFVAGLAIVLAAALVLALQTPKVAPAPAVAETYPTQAATRPLPPIPAAVEVAPTTVTATASEPAATSTTAAPQSSPAPPSKPQPRMTTLQISSDPLGAKVFVDRVEVGVTPYKLTTRLGATHRIEIQAKGRTPVVRELAVEREADALQVIVPAATKPAKAKSTTGRATDPATDSKPGMTPIYVDDP